MDFRPIKHRFSSDTVSLIIDDMLDVAKIAQDKPAYRLKLLEKRLEAEKNRTMLSGKEIQRAVEILSDKNTSAYQMSRTFKKLSVQLDKYYNQLVKVFNTLN